MADSDENEERQPLLVVPSTGATGSAYNTVDEQNPVNPDTDGQENVAVNYIDASELPPPYTPTGHGSIPTINCKVCHAVIILEGKLHQHVVKCSLCNEATAIRAAPAGKKYVRCKCNCLLICKTSSRRVACPRQTCKRVIVLGPLPTDTMTNDSARIVCAHCQRPFLFIPSPDTLARCPNCRKISSIGSPRFARNRAIAFGAPGLLLLLSGIVVVVLTQRSNSVNRGVIVAYVILFVVSVAFLLRAVYYCTMKVSRAADAETNSDIQ